MDELRILPDEDEVNEVPGNGVVLIGNSELYERVKKGKITTQAYTRIGLQRAYSTMRLTNEDVKLLFPMFSGEEQSKELKLIASVCRSQHSIRTAKHIVKNAIRNEDISYEACEQPQPAPCGTHLTGISGRFKGMFNRMKAVVTFAAGAWRG